VTVVERAALGGFSDVDDDPEAAAAELLQPRLGARLLDVWCGAGERGQFLWAVTMFAVAGARP
jgi:hypothetical protein